MSKFPRFSLVAEVEALVGVTSVARPHLQVSVEVTVREVEAEIRVRRGRVRAQNRSTELDAPVARVPPPQTVFRSFGYGAGPQRDLDAVRACVPYRSATRQLLLLTLASRKTQVRATEPDHADRVLVPRIPTHFGD